MQKDLVTATYQRCAIEEYAWIATGERYGAGMVHNKRRTAQMYAWISTKKRRDKQKAATLDEEKNQEIDKKKKQGVEKL